MIQSCKAYESRGPDPAWCQAKAKTYRFLYMAFKALHMLASSRQVPLPPLTVKNLSSATAASSRLPRHPLPQSHWT